MKVHQVRTAKYFIPLLLILQFFINPAAYAACTWQFVGSHCTATPDYDAEWDYGASNHRIGSIGSRHWVTPGFYDAYWETNGSVVHCGNGVDLEYWIFVPSPECAPASVDATCGVANNVPTANMPSSDLCSSGDPTAVSSSVDTWIWQCLGIDGGTDTSCAAPRSADGTCGPANGSNVYVSPTSGLCATGSSSTVSGSGPFLWDCLGAHGGSSASCSANLSVNGVCGPANGGASPSAPATGLCSAGTNTAVSGTGPFAWTCTGLNGGTSDACSSQIAIDGACGPSNNVPTAAPPAAGLCASGTATAVTGTGPWNWSCIGSGGGATSTCMSPLLPPSPPPSFGGACPVAS
jgi:hypothetical protein